ncbi:YfhO family protein [Paenibacillus thiaminolyticus]|uniref:YfhO family protein n=1 Tax=Paenibacillus thiaminolyticus TaxID=49283 RepID=UPI00232EAD86|nr:YfhO family protein [Paenibacillus thiaminolyticus]WCF07869.1 YfhO family protein [Paenibacillus thiaminolyticus]
MRTTWLLKFSIFSDSKLSNREKLAFPLMIAIVVLIYSPVIFGKLWMKWDMYGAIFPTLVSISEHLKGGDLPLWEFFVQRGVPLANLLGIPIWSPFTIIFGLIGFNQYLLQLQFILIIVMSAAFMFLSLTTITKNKWLCGIGGIAYSTSGFFVANAEHLTFIVAACLFPLIHYAFYKCITGSNYKYAILLGVASGMLILNSYPPFVIVTIVFLLCELIFSIKAIKPNLKTLGLYGLIALVVGVAVSLVCIYTTLQIMSEITREKVPWDVATVSSLNIWNWISALSPGLVQLSKNVNPMLDISMNNLYLALPIGIALFARKLSTKSQYYFVILIIFAALLSMGNNGYVYRLFYEFLPGMNTFKFPAGLRYLWFYFVVFLAVNNYDYYVRNKDNRVELKKPFEITSYIIGGIYLIIGLYLMLVPNPETMPGKIAFELILTAAVLMIFTRCVIVNNSKCFISSLLIIVTFFSLLGVVRNGEYTIGTKERPRSYNEEIKHLYQQPERALVSNKFVTTNEFMQSETIFTRNFQNNGYIGSFELKKFNQAKNQGLIPNEGDPVIWYIYENDASVMTRNRENLELNWSNAHKDSVGENLYVKGNQISVDVDIRKDGYIILEQTFYPGWKATINDRPVEILEISNGTIGIEVSAGEHHIVFNYEPTITKITAYITFGTWFLLVFYAIYLIYRKLKTNGSEKKSNS